MNRRDFVTCFGVGWVASCLPLALAACSSQKISKDWETIGTSGELDQTGQLLVPNSPIGSVLVVGKSSGSNLIAVNPTCTHRGCTVAWKAEAKKFACPCHGSEYGIDGKVQKGPALRPLGTYKVKIEGDSVLVKAVGG